IRDYLDLMGFRVDCAGEREEAEALILHTRYDLMILDLGLTGVHGREGFEVIRLIKERSPQCPIVLMTANVTPGLELESRRLGADHFLQKPAPLSVILRVANTLLEKAVS
ncbi:MAG TPA: response regulator, partial [Nitrospiria bacterium]